DRRLLIVGSSEYGSRYVRRLEQEAREDRRILLPGPIYDQDLLRELWTNCVAYVHGNEVGGTNPALLQAMASGCFVICRDCVFNREVLEGRGIYFHDVDSLAAGMEWALANEGLLESYRRRAQQRIADAYDWESVAHGYEELAVLAGTRRWRRLPDGRRSDP
ncbi:MAG TPA: glycosyltransferase, partial [Spirochaetia bacterium]|nr:glycosyltransferase [Spirochaetia bacterium]